jgi:hypothetical protein
MTTSLDAMLLGKYLAAAGVLIAMTRGRPCHINSAHPFLSGMTFDAKLVAISFRVHPVLGRSKPPSERVKP